MNVYTNTSLALQPRRIIFPTRIFSKCFTWGMIILFSIQHLVFLLIYKYNNISSIPTISCILFFFLIEYLDFHQGATSDRDILRGMLYISRRARCNYKSLTLACCRCGLFWVAYHRNHVIFGRSLSFIDIVFTSLTTENNHYMFMTTPTEGNPLSEEHQSASSNSKRHQGLQTWFKN